MRRPGQNESGQQLEETGDPATHDTDVGPTDPILMAAFDQVAEEEQQQEELEEAYEHEMEAGPQTADQTLPLPEPAPTATHDDPAGEPSDEDSFGADGRRQVSWSEPTGEPHPSASPGKRPRYEFGTDLPHQESLFDDLDSRHQKLARHMDGSISEHHTEEPCFGVYLQELVEDDNDMSFKMTTREQKAFDREVRYRMITEEHRKDYAEGGGQGTAQLALVRGGGGAGAGGESRGTE